MRTFYCVYPFDMFVGSFVINMRTLTVLINYIVFLTHGSPWKHSLLYTDKPSMSLKAQLLPLDTCKVAVCVCRGLSAQGVR